MLMTNESKFAQNVRYLATQARQPVVHYEHHDVGYNYRLSNLLAALGRAQLSRLDSMITKRRELRDEYKSLFSSIEGIEIFGAPGDHEDNAWLTAVSVNSSITGWTASELSKALAEHNIESRPLWKPMHLQPIFSKFRGEISGASEGIFNSHLTLPSGSALSSSQRRFVLGKISEFTGVRI